MTGRGSDETLPRTTLGDDRTVAATSADASTIQDPDVELDALLAADMRYTYGAPLGEGGMGEVHVVRDRRFGREIAIKAMRTEHEANDTLRWRFIREARVQGQLEHPSIVPVYDLGRDPSGRAFFTMRRIRGETLDAALERLRARDAAASVEHTRHKLLAAFVRVCLAVDYAHSRGVVHRDLKPANVILGSFGEVYVLDWGLAKVTGAQRSLDPRASAPAAVETVDADAVSATQAGFMLGTPAYMSPEQARGETDAIGPPADVYALGAILFEILTLEPLHGTGTPRELVLRAMKGVDARASDRAEARDIPPELEAVCVRATALDASARHPSARAVAEEVEAYLSGDRDLQLRRDLASAHLSRARSVAAALATADDPVARRDALREVGRAVALAPDDREALSLLGTLLTDTPKQVPPEVAAAVSAAVYRPHGRIRRRVALVVVAAWATLGPLCAWAGVRDVRLAALTIVAWLLVVAIVLMASRRDRGSEATGLYTATAYGIAIAATTVIFGPLIFTPAVTVAVGVLATLSAPRLRQRISMLAVLMTLSLGLPVALAWLGLHPVAHTFEGDVLRIHAGALHFSGAATYLLITSAHVVICLVGTFLAATYRDVVTAAELRTQTLAWNLRQLVPPGADARVGGLAQN